MDKQRRQARTHTHTHTRALLILKTPAQILQQFTFQELLVVNGRQEAVYSWANPLTLGRASRRYN